MFALIVFSIVVNATLAGPAVKYGIFREDCLERFLSFDLSDVDCIKFTASKGIGYGIVAGACFFKVPQIMKVLQSGSTAGISSFTIYVEFFNLIGLIGNSMRLELPFSIYGEGVFTNIQNAILILMIWNYDKSISPIEKVLFAAAMFAYAWVIFASGLMNPFYWECVAKSQILMICL